MKSAARWVSVVAHPFAMVLVMVGGTAVHDGTARDAMRAVLLVAVVSLLPMGIFMLWQVRSGAWADADASGPTERPHLLSVGGVALVALIGYAVLVRPESFLLRGAAGMFALFAGSAIAGRWLKVSLHLAFAAFAATTLLAIGSPAGWVAFAAIPALGWSRLALARHSPGEVAAGILLGVAVGGAATRL